MVLGRAVLIVMDSFGIGGAADAHAYGDAGADTLGHIAQACAAGRADRDGLRKGPLALPHLDALGLRHAAASAAANGVPTGLWGSAGEISRGKDTPSGHWEIAGVPVSFDWGYFPQTVPTFPDALISQLIDDAGIPGILGDKHASGTTLANAGRLFGRLSKVDHVRILSGETLSPKGRETVERAVLRMLAKD